MRHDAFAVFEIWREDLVKACEVQPGSGHQGCEAGNKVQRFQNDMDRSIMKRLCVAVHDTPLVIDRQPTIVEHLRGLVDAKKVFCHSVR